LRVILDTNILINREDDRVIADNVQNLMRIISETNTVSLIHPVSITDIRKDKNEERKRKMLSKIAAYPSIEAPPDFRKDREFITKIGEREATKNQIDNDILYSIYRNAVDFLISEDKGIHRKAEKLGIQNRVLTIDQAIQLIGKTSERKKLLSPPALRRTPTHNLNLKDSFFDSLRFGYPEFDDWMKKVSAKGRECWAYFREDGSIGALLIFKQEDEHIDCDTQITKMKRLKICTLKVDETGHRIGELLIKISSEYAVKNRLQEMFITHFTTGSDDALVKLISEYGFIRQGSNSRGEEVFLKSLQPDGVLCSDLSPLEIAKRYYPSYYDGQGVNKFIIPIRKEYHSRLFTDFSGRQTTLLEFSGEFIIEGNTIKKAYLCHSKSKLIEPGDVVIFYQSRDLKQLTHIGIVEMVKHFQAGNKKEIQDLLVKRTAYSDKELTFHASKPSLVLFFTQHFCLPCPVDYKDLVKIGAIKGQPQSITRISHEKYLDIKRRCSIDEHFTIDKAKVC